MQICVQYAISNVTNVFMAILKLFWGMYFDILAKACIFLVNLFDKIEKIISKC